MVHSLYNNALARAVSVKIGRQSSSATREVVLEHKGAFLAAAHCRQDKTYEVSTVQQPNLPAKEPCPKRTCTLYENLAKNKECPHCTAALLTVELWRDSNATRKTKII
ncbi:hypothetical protein EVAR_63392_1 [Eumeta japonica]|uniref:Uncharacterized protein n=1 Tax=Eumeta variegata TaxID=151549 RepID=A0A4C1YYD7_EUMVA|nr:hypothetical protein EVAR_63392_1 [Eumeta japonica]